MKIGPLLLSGSLLLSAMACKNTNEQTSGRDRNAEIISAVNRYALDSLSGGQVLEPVSNLQSVSNGDLRFTYDLKDAKFGEINGDALEDAVIPVKLVRGHFPVRIDHVILLQKDTGYQAVSVLEKIYKIKEIANLTITAEYTEQTVDSPIYGCRECITVMKYQLKDGVVAVVQ